MGKLRIEYVQLGAGRNVDGTAVNVIKRVIASAPTLAVTTTATAAGSRPTVPPLQNGEPHITRLTALEGNLIVAWGSNPTAADNQGLLLMEGMCEGIPMAAGDLISAIEVV